MEGLEIAVVLGITILVGGVIAARVRVAPPLVLLVLGAGLGFVPTLGEVQLPPDLVLLLFLPALLYWESLNTSLREIWKNMRVISLLAVGLVLATAAVIAVIGHAFGLPWSVAIALGAILAPTDATAVGAVAGALPRRTLTTLRAESLINDGTALAIYAVAVAAAVAERDVSFGVLSLQVVLSYVVGIAIGAAVGLLCAWLRRRMTEARLGSTLSILTPFLAYLPAEYLHVSGVVAVVVAGLVMSQAGPRVITARTRTQSFSFWQVTSYLLNGSLFVLIGFQLHQITAGTDPGDWADVIGLGLAAALSVIGVRLAWVNTTPYIIRALDRRPSQRLRRVGIRQRTPLAWAGFRGAVSLAAALALPTETASGDAFPARELVIAVTFIVILVTLLVQGLSMPAIVRWAHLEPDPTEHEEEALAQREATQAALDELDSAAQKLETPQQVRDSVRNGYEEHLRRLLASGETGQVADDEAAEELAESRLRLALLGAKRRTLVRLRDERRIDDVVLRRVQSRIDIEELRLAERSEDE